MSAASRHSPTHARRPPPEAYGLSANILPEPKTRDSGAAVAAAAAWVSARDPQGVLAIVAADHHVPDAIAFAYPSGSAFNYP